MRAASVRINDVSGVAGFVQPNDSVDVLDHAPDRRRASNTQLTDVLLQNVRVIAIDQEAKNADGTPKVAKTATLEVNPLDAQKLALAQQIGDLSLVLRKPGEQNNPVVETVSMNDLRYNMYGGARYPAPAVVGSSRRRASAGAMDRVAAQIASTPRPARRRRREAARGRRRSTSASRSRSIAGPRATRSRWGTVMGAKALKRLRFARRQAGRCSPRIRHRAQISVASGVNAGELDVPVNKSQVVRADRPYAKALIGNPDIADIVPITDTSVYVLGKKTGTTSLTLYDRSTA